MHNFSTFLSKLSPKLRNQIFSILRKRQLHNIIEGTAIQAHIQAELLAVAAKNQFREEVWKKQQDKFNVIGIGINITMDETTGAINEEFFIKAYLFDINDAIDFPKSINGIEVKYIPTNSRPVA